MHRKPVKPVKNSLRARAKSGRPPMVADAELAELLKQYGGNMSSVAAKIGIARQSVAERVKKNENLSAVLEETRQRLVDMAESGLRSAVANGEEWAIKRVLDSKRGAERGWRYDLRIDLEAKHTFEPDFDLLRAALSTGCEVEGGLRNGD